MKIYLFSTLLLAGSLNTACAQQGSFVLTGTVKGKDNGKMFLMYEGADEKYRQDSCTLQNGRFEFKGPLKEPVMATISSIAQVRSFTDPNYARIYLEPAPMTVTL